MKIDTYMHDNCKSLTDYNFCYECSRDLISFPVDQKYEFVNEIEN